MENTKSHTYLGATPVIGQTRRNILQALQACINSRGSASLFSTPFDFSQHQNYPQSQMDFSTLFNLVLANQIQTVQQFLRLARDIFDQAQYLEKQYQSAVNDAEKSLMRELRKSEQFQSIFYANYRELCSLQDLKPRPITKSSVQNRWQVLFKANDDQKEMNKLLEEGVRTRDGKIEIDLRSIIQ
ncbi:Bromodomain-containing protein [Spironucleus salmonicida]|uniref:Bromodomain-containing protein n=1 Tax=Spironucleus salmonicida TaxID=348837 RepID=V6LWV9_9EUKA|nr:Bromodomain-containing protein [Spironucleus salmonicida]|eukprot:EST45289.1 Bromodomain-containing protein [Spironucleus salmonicida]